MFDRNYMLNIKDNCVQWIRDYFAENGPDCNAIVGISGGKDSSVVAALCVEALGADRVIGVLMPQGKQKDIDTALDLVNYLEIPYTIINIGGATAALKGSVSNGLNGLARTDNKISENTIINMPARIRMTTLFAVSQSMNGRVANTCNLSEDWVGYATLFGDGAGQFSPLSKLTVREVKYIGYLLGLPEKFIEKTPIDGLCGQTDEEKLGFTYDVLDTYIREGYCDDAETQKRIDTLHKNNTFKFEPMPVFNPLIPSIIW